MNKKAILFLGLICLFKLSNSQIIKGSIIDKTTKNPVPFANVYLDGTTIGTTSNNEGYFTLNTRGKKTIPIVISTIGYQSLRIPEYSTDQDLHIELAANTYELEGLEIKAKKISRQPRLNLFKESFLGISKNAASCIIENEDAILLEMSSETNTLYARATEPLIIINNALGYKINYHLREFRCSGEDVYYEGDYFFTEIETEDKSVSRKYIQNRIKAYEGSRLSLIRSFYNKSLKKNNFEVYYTNYKRVKMDEIYQKELADGDKLIYFLGDLIVYYKYEDEHEIIYRSQNRTQMVATSYIKQKGGVRVTKDGYFDPNSLVWSGDIAFDRVADLLPYDYKVKH